jgi:hypothetical protein
MGAIASIVFTFVLTGIIGNKLIQSWQHRNWLQQQRLLGQEKEYDALKQLSDEIIKVAGKRLYRMRRLLAAVRSLSDDILKQRVLDYDHSLLEWNDSLGSYYVRLTFYSNYYNATYLEGYLQAPFAAAGKRIEKIIQKRNAGQAITSQEVVSIDSELNDLQARIFRFNRDLTRLVESVRRKVYFGDRISYSPNNLPKFSTWELVISLFIREVDHHSVVRPAADLHAP